MNRVATDSLRVLGVVLRLEAIRGYPQYTRGSLV